MKPINEIYISLYAKIIYESESKSKEEFPVETLRSTHCET
jgi:hypothetical protein